MEKKRPSPSQHASETTPGVVMKGNDGAFWVCKELPNETHRWVRSAHEPGKAYLTHDNGGAPFKVFINGKNVSVFVWDLDAHDQISNNYQKAGRKKQDHFASYAYFKKVWSTMSAKKVFVGNYVGKDHKFSKHDLGNSNLICVGNKKYVFIGDRITSFTTPEEIVSFQSPVGNSDVPYPWACGEKYTYLMNEGIYLSNNLFKQGKDPYEFYYRADAAITKKIKKENQFKIKVIEDRVIG